MNILFFNYRWIYFILQSIIIDQGGEVEKIIGRLGEEENLFYFLPWAVHDDTAQYEKIRGRQASLK